MDNLCEDLHVFLCTCQVRVEHNLLNMRETQREKLACLLFSACFPSSKTHGFQYN